MKILLMGDASGYHCNLAVGLRRLGHDVTVASHGSYWMDTARDINLNRHTSKVGGAYLWLRLHTSLAPKLKGYDVVQLSSPGFVDLRPHRLSRLFDRLKRDNGSIFLTALGSDPNFIDECLDPASPLEYSEWRLWDSPGSLALAQPHKVAEWHNKSLVDLTHKIYEEVDGVVTALYEYDVACRRVVPAEKIAYGGIPIDMERVKQLERPLGAGKINLFLGRHKSRLAEKGTDVLERICRTIVEANPRDFSFDLVENLPYAQYLRRLRSADIVFDQLYSYTPATNALLAMAGGQVVVSGGEEAYYRFIGEERLRPVINVVPGRESETVERVLSLASNRDELRELGRQGVQLVRKHNEAGVVARRFVDFWERKLSEK